jgi:intein/homing endonuclease
VYFGDRKQLGKTHTICTWQSLNILDKKHKDGSAVLSLAEFLDEVRTIIVDECFAGDTLITTPNGQVPIKDLKAGDKVINLCEKTKQYKEDTVVKVHKNLTHSQSEKMLEIEFDNGIKTKVTANHKFLTDNGWVRADQLTEDLEIININTYS